MRLVNCLAVVAVATVILACTGDVATHDETVSRASQAPSNGGHVDVGGYDLAYECRGTGTPTILLEAGYDSGGIGTWSSLMGELAAISMVCTYDRAGTGTSDPRPEVRDLTSADQASELHALLDAASIAPPYVLVAHSYGGFVARLFADGYPDEASGIVLIESSHEDEIDAYRQYYGDRPAGDWVDGGDLLDIEATEEALRAARDYGDMPMIVIRAERYEDVLSEDLWRETQADLATLSSNAVHVEAMQSGHFVMEPGNNPDVIVRAVRAVVEAARTGRSLPPCEGVFADVDAGCP